MHIVFIVGTAGSGKSRLAAAFCNWLRLSDQKAAIVNLDPGVLKLPYSPEIDVRNHVNVSSLMEKYGLGPNGALILAADLVAEGITEISREVESLQSDFVLVDTPGQIELFAFRASGPYIASELTKNPKAVVYLFDATFSLSPLNYVSNLFLSAAVYNRLLTSQILLLSKCDLLPEEEVHRVVEWSEDHMSLEGAIESELKGTRRLISRDMMQAVQRLGLGFSLIPVSAKTNEGMLDFNAALERTLTAGDRYTR